MGLFSELNSVFTTSDVEIKLQDIKKEEANVYLDLRTEDDYGFVAYGLLDCQGQSASTPSS